MGLPAVGAALCFIETLLVLATATQDRQLQVGLFPPYSATLSPNGPCESEGDGYTFVFNLPPMTVNLPKQLLDLERLMEELQLLKDNVDELRKTCKDCALGQTKVECTQGAEEDQSDIAQKLEKKNGNADEQRKKCEKPLAKEKIEQVVAVGKNVRITGRKNTDRTKTEMTGDTEKHNIRLGDSGSIQNSTYGRSEMQLWQVMESRKQTEAANRRKDGGAKTGNVSGEIARWESHDKEKLDEQYISDKSHNINRGEHMVHIEDKREKSRSEATKDTPIWQDKHDKASHEERQEKKFVDRIMEQPTISDRPAWLSKIYVDLNQMATDRVAEERGKEKSDANSRVKNEPKSSQSGRHVWLDETMESSSAEKVKLTVEIGGTDDNLGQDQRQMSQTIKSAEDSEQGVKDERTELGRFRQFENRTLMEGTDMPSSSQASVVNSTPSHWFIDLDQALTLTSPPPFTTSHFTTAVGEGLEQQVNGENSIKEQLGVDVQLTEGYERGKNEGETNVAQLAQPVLESIDEKADLGKQYKSKTDVDVALTSLFSTDLKQGKQNIVVPPTQSSVSRKSTSFEHTHVNSTSAKRAKHQNEEHSNLDIPAFTMSQKDEKTPNSEFDQVKSSNASTNIYPINTNLHITFDLKQGENKTTLGISQNNQSLKGSSIMHANGDQLTEMSESKPKFTFVVSDPTSLSRNSKSHFSQDFDQEQSKKISTNPHKMEIKYSQQKSQMNVNTTTSTSKFTKQKGIILRGGKKTHSASPNNQDIKPSSPMHVNVGTCHLSQCVQSFKVGAEDEIKAASTVSSSPAATRLNKGDGNLQKQPTFYNKDSESEHPALNPQLEKDYSISLYPTVSSLHITKHLKKDHGLITKKTSATKDKNKKNLDKEHLTFDASNKFAIQPTTHQLAVDSTISHNKPHTNSGGKKILIKTVFGHALSNYENDNISDSKTGKVNQSTSGLSKNITRSPSLREDEFISAIFTSHHLSPTTMSPSMSGYKRKSKSRTLQNQRPKLTFGMKPEANPKVKNLKNDHKLDHSPLPDTYVRSDRRQKHPKMTATSVHVATRSDKTDGGLTKKDSPKLKHFIQKARDTMKNSSINIMLPHNRSLEFNSTLQRVNGGIQKNPKVNLKVPKIDQKPKLQMPKVKAENLKLETSQKVKSVQVPKQKIPKEKKFADLKNGTKVLTGPKEPNKSVKPKVMKIKPTLKAEVSLPQTDKMPTPSLVLSSLETLNYNSARNQGSDLVMHNVIMDLNSRSLSNMGLQTTQPTPFIALTAEPNKATPTPVPTKIEFNGEKKSSPSSQAPQVLLWPTERAHFTSAVSTGPHRGPKTPAMKSTTPSVREMKVKIKQVTAFLNKSSLQHPPGRLLDAGSEQPNDDDNAERKPDVQPRDCSDHITNGHTQDGVYLVTPKPSVGSVPVLCDMIVDGGGWTVLQRRQDGSVSFNRSWAEYRDGFGLLDGEFWLGNHLLHLLTWDRSMELRVELEDFEGVREHAQYQLFKVASERMRFRLSVDGYSGTAGNALRFSSQYDHHNRAFTTPDKDNDRYPSGNCGAYYNSGWWFDACMSANLNGRYYRGPYKGVRDGIYWGTWHNISSEYYPTNERLVFKTVTMKVRPRGFKAPNLGRE